MTLIAIHEINNCLVSNRQYWLLRGQVSKETVVLRRWEYNNDNLVLSTGLIM